ncbi:Hypothetical predicted protein, partial [Paramuricea clavata]
MSFKLPSFSKSKVSYQEFTKGLETFLWTDLSDTSEIGRDFKDAAREGNEEELLILHKQLLQHFKSMPGYNAYAIEMPISIIQLEAFLSQAESHQIMWAGTVNWKGGNSRNIEIRLLQENRNKDLKYLIKAMGANNTTNAIERASRAAGG